MSNPTCKVYTLRTIRVTEPDGSVREYAKGFEFMVSPDLALAWEAEGAASIVHMGVKAEPAPKRSTPKPRASRIETPNPKTEDAPEIPAARPLED